MGPVGSFLGALVRPRGEQSGSVSPALSAWAKGNSAKETSRQSAQRAGGSQRLKAYLLRLPRYREYCADRPSTSSVSDPASCAPSSLG